MPKGMEFLYKSGSKKIDPKKLAAASPATRKRALAQVKKAKTKNYGKGK